tara:strand:+ start:362 stop:1159 length:798 start_codon:yes stop_codon:yes gene_type:complete
VGQVRGLQLPDRFGEIEARNQQEREDLKSGRESDKGLAMLKAGMTMAGGTSSNALSNISAGVNAGISEWSAAEKEFRVANQAIRSADNAIAIARAQRDAEQLAMAVKVKMHFEEMRQKSLDRAAAASASAGARADANEDRKARTELAREAQAETRISHLGTLAQRYDSTASTGFAKLAAIKADPMADPVKQAEREAEARSEIENAQSQGAYYRNMYKDSVVDREVNAGRLTRIDGPDHVRQLKESGTLKKGMRIILPNGKIGTVE